MSEQQDKVQHNPKDLFNKLLNLYREEASLKETIKDVKDYASQETTTLLPLPKDLISNIDKAAKSVVVDDFNKKKYTWEVFEEVYKEYAE